jgi:hypothetical protein
MFYAPYIPLVLSTERIRQDMNWKQVLNAFYDREVSTSLKPDWQIINTVFKVMQDRYPGPYTIYEYYDPKICRLRLNIAFEDPLQETMWLIKNSE